MRPSKLVKNIEEIKDSSETKKFIESIAKWLTDDRFFAFVGSDYERYHGIMVAIFRKDNKFGILIHNAFNPTGRKGEYFYLETVEEIISFLDKDADVRDIIMGIASTSHYLQTPRKENMEIDFLEMIRSAYGEARTKLVQLILPCGYDEGMMIATEALIPWAKVVAVG